MSRPLRKDVTRERLGKVLEGRFRLEACLGVGGTGAVYRARVLGEDTGLPALVAVKILHPEMLGNAARRSVFLEEARIAGLVRHPGAVRVFDAGVTVDGTAYIVFELLTGRSLHDGLVGWGDLLLDEVVRVTRAVLAVLAEAHRAGVIHCDVKPENIFVCDDGTVKLLDFGVARVTGEARRTGIAGTASFMAPEQAAGDWASVDARSDVWSVGATFYTLITGALLSPALPSASERVVLPADVPAPLAQVIARALEADPARRYADGRAMLDALEVAALESGVPRSSRTLLDDDGADDDDMPARGPTETSGVFARSVPGDGASAELDDSFTLRIGPYPTAQEVLSRPPPKPRRWRWLAKLGLGVVVAALAGAAGATLAHVIPADVASQMPAQVGSPVSKTTTSGADLR